MEHQSITNLNSIKNEAKLKGKSTQVIAVSKTFTIDTIKPLLDYGHTHFGENKIQESLQKWTEIKNSYQNLNLHMIGKLQTNKVKYALPLFDYLHSLDNFKLAKKISEEQNKKNKYMKIFIQVNLENEVQKGGIDINNLNEFYKECVLDLKLNIVGLMCIPPIEGNTKLYFKKMAELNNSLNLKELSMGMSSDYPDAIKYGSTFIRVGTKIFGNRT